MERDKRTGMDDILLTSGDQLQYIAINRRNRAPNTPNFKTIIVLNRSSGDETDDDYIEIISNNVPNKQEAAENI